MTTPSEALTAVILPQLVERELFLPENAVKYKAKLVSGSMTPEDWLLAIEKPEEQKPSQ